MSNFRFCKSNFSLHLNLRDDGKTKKNVSIRALPELGGGGFTLARIFLRPFLLKEKVLSMVAAAERVGKVARIEGWGVFFWLIRAMPELKRFFCFALFPQMWKTLPLTGSAQNTSSWKHQITKLKASLCGTYSKPLRAFITGAVISNGDLPAAVFNDKNGLKVREAPTKIYICLFGHCPNSHWTPARCQTGTLWHLFSGKIMQMPVCTKTFLLKIGATNHPGKGLDPPPQTGNAHMNRCKF